MLARGTAWLDTGTVRVDDGRRRLRPGVEARQGHKIGCIEEAAWRRGWITDDDLLRLAELDKSGYGHYLERLIRYSHADARFAARS